MSEQHFRISSGLKSLIGRELITDDFIAVFELVKNSFDAMATRVVVRFSDIYGDSPQVEIGDNGKGMSRRDITDKWMFVAYSAKKEGTEDYRAQIRSTGIYAGAKGIGRFSCDKLGQRLELVSRDDPAGSWNKLSVDWGRFEVDATEDFINIPVSLTRLRNPPSQFKFKKGTLLRIQGLREPWDRDKILKLKRSLTKLINPNQSHTSRKFSITIEAEEEQEADSDVPAEDSWNRVNGEIRNFLFEELKIKATHIHVSIPDKGDIVTTTLEDRGKFVYKIAEENPFPLSGIDIYLFSLNRSAKLTFTRRMGLPPVQFGSVFLFKNGFRVYPFGEVGADPWGIDRRKAQGQSRFFGTRDLLGRVEISGVNPDLTEVTSRDGGLLRNSASESLRQLFIEYALKRLERYAIDIIKYGNEELEASGEFKSKALDLILGLTKSRSIISVDYNEDLIDVLREASSKSLNSLISQFSRLAAENNDAKLEKEVRLAKKRIEELEEARREAESVATDAEAQRESAEAQAEEAIRRAEAAATKAEVSIRAQEKLQSQNLFLQSMVGSDTENLVGLHHHIGIAAGTIQNYVKTMAERIRSGKPVSTEMFLETLGKISMQASQISSSSRFATKANFETRAAIITADVVEFVREYLLNVCQGMYFSHSGSPIEFLWIGSRKTSFQTKFRPFEITVLVDNLISNSRKAGATKITATASVSASADALSLAITDNGKGIPPDSRKRLFELGFTTTGGSGFGLYHASKIAEGMGGTLSIDPDYRSGARFLLEIHQ